MQNQLSFLSLGGIGNVTKNMYLYECDNQILIIDCGLGFADETMVGVDLLLPDISYLSNSKKKIAGMVLTHGHEDHIGALPFILPQLPIIPIFATPLTAAFANEKLKEFKNTNQVKSVTFDGGEITLGTFKVSFIRVTHSVPDAAHLFIRTPLGNVYHGSDFKFDLTPSDGKSVEFQKIAKASQNNILFLASDCLGAEKEGHTPSELTLLDSFEKEMRQTQGKFIVTTYSSNISRLNLAITVAQKQNRKVCFVGRSLNSTKEVAKKMGYMKIPQGMEIRVEQLKNFKDWQLLLFVAGSQGQENSAMTRIVEDEFREIKIEKDDTVIFSADPIPGNEVSINALIDEISKKGAKVVYSQISDDFHVSGHGYSFDLSLLIALLKPKKLIPIGGTYRQMVAYKTLAKRLDYKDEDIFLLETGQKVNFFGKMALIGEKIAIKNVYLDQISGEEVESFVLRDRQKLSEGGIVVLVLEVESDTGRIVNTPQIIIRGFTPSDQKKLSTGLERELKKPLIKKGRVMNWFHVRKQISEIAEGTIYRMLRRRPLVLPVVIEV
ncbi:MAG: ribonuclease J [Candidatus Levyibacteriota bacterium]